MSNLRTSASRPFVVDSRRPAIVALVGRCLLALVILLGVAGPVQTAAAAPTVGSGFTVTPSDLAHILKQIKIAEAHAANTTAETGPCGALLGRGPNQVPDALTSYGLRTVDGSCNNLIKGRETWGAADEVFPRLTQPTFSGAGRVAFGPTAGSPTSYAQTSGEVYDSEPRVISNLISDQTATNPAAIAAAGYPIRSQNAPGKFPCSTDPDPVAGTPGEPAGCVPTGETLPIPNITTDVGLSPPFNSLFTLFGQFFDHGIDQTVKGGGTVFVPLRSDDPLRTVGPDGKANTGDEVPASKAFMVLTRAQNQPGPDGKLGTADDIRDASNTDSPYVDQSQTYASHASHQVFLREYALNTEGRPVSTGALFGGPAGAMANWADVKRQAADVLGLKLTDKDALSVPQLAVDPYGKFLPGPQRGLPMYVTADGLVEGDLTSPVPVPSDVLSFNTPFLTDIAHHADPTPQDTDRNPGTPPVPPAPDSDTTASADFARQPSGTYDDEMLDAHVTAGDGRVNENIGLTAVHQVFHSEHNRLIGQIKDTLVKDTSAKGVAALAEWKSSLGASGWNGERLFQAARFINEMEYQHIVFEEFARKIQPALQPFTVYHTDLNPAVSAEFAHAVYRFGHSMLTETISRTNADGSDNTVSLLEGFLNPPAYNDGGPAGKLTAEEAAGSIIMGMSDEVGSELDEFVTNTLRSNLLGLPLDLAAINLARGREAGVPSLNEFRRQLHQRTGDAQLTPYTSWADFGQNVKHPESVINFVAAYGTHPSITGASTLAGKRAAAKAIVDPGPAGPAPTAEMTDFMNNAGEWAGKETGLNRVDLWIGGLAEKTNLFGGHLGSTFNYVFESQLTHLQNGDRFYYLLRTAGMNLKAQLEANSFAELAMRNTVGTKALKADAFATADCKFELARLAGTAEGYAQFGPTVADDPRTACDENALLLRKPDGTIQYRERNSVDQPGINGQAVYNGVSDHADRVTGGNDNDTFWGDSGDDVIEGQGGDDTALGGEGADRITDKAGDDVLSGGPGHDYLNGGHGLDLLLGGDGQDVTNGGANDNQTFGGPGTDFIQSGDGADASFGDGDDDWLQGGSGQDLLIGDHGAPFLDDPAQTQPGNDVLVGQVGENDYDAEGGDDVMSANAAVDRYAGAAGFDWVNHQYDTVAADDDMRINANLLGAPLPVVVNRDRWQETEAISGSSFDDVLRGDEAVPTTVGGGGFTGCNALDQAGLDRIAGLDDIVPPLLTPLAPIEAASAPGACPLQGNVWGAGNILLGGLGSDQIEGRGADDIIDGDRYLRVRISVRTDPANAATEIGTTDLLERPYQSGNPRTLAADIAAGVVQPAQLVIVREIITPTAEEAGAASNEDVAVFTGAAEEYTVTSPEVGVLVVSHNGGADGTDTLRNVEQLRFSDVTVPAVAGGGGEADLVPPTVAAAAPSDGATGVGVEDDIAILFSEPVAGVSSATIMVRAGSATGPLLTATVSYDPDTGMALINPVEVLDADTTYVVEVLGGPDGISDLAGVPMSTTSWSFRTAVPADVTPPSVTGRAPTTNATVVERTANVAATFSEAVVGVSGTTMTLRVGTATTGALVPATVDYDPATQIATLNPTAELASDTRYTLRLTGSPSAIRDEAGNALTSLGWSFVTGPAPTVRSQVPAANGTGFSVSANVTATFSEAVTGVNASTATLRAGTSATGTLVAAAVSYNTTTRMLTINPNANLTADTRYTVRLVGGSSGIRDNAGNPLGSTSWTFLTGPAPTLTATSPGSGATGVRRNANITATFSEAVTGATTGTVVLRNATTNAVIPATVSRNGTTNQWILNPSVTLASSTRYQVTLTGGASAIRDLAGNAFTSRSWTFTTGTAL